MHVWAHGLTLDDIITTGGLTHSWCAKGVQICEVRVTFRFPDSRNELMDIRSSAYNMVVTILGGRDGCFTSFLATVLLGVL